MERMTGLTDKRVFADVDVLRNLMDKVEVRNNIMKIEEQDEYERIILLFEKFRFGGKTLRDYELYVLECFKNKFIKLLFKKSKIHKKLILRYKYLL